MHLLICGLGSIGRRHLRHFRALGVERIDAFRTGLATLADQPPHPPERTFHSLEEALRAKPDAVVICNPTALHLPVALAAVRAGAHVLVEKPLSDSLVDCDLLDREARAAGRVVKVAMNLRFHPLLQKARTILAEGLIGRPVLGRAHFGAYLPDWHPWEDYRQGYAARRDLGGGAALTHIHEVDYMLWLLGAAEQVRGFAVSHHPLGTDVDEASGIVVRHVNGAVSTITLSLCQKPASRRVEIMGDRGSLSLDLLGNTWSLQPQSGPAQSGLAENYQVEESYRSQAAAFLEIARSGKDTGKLAGIEEACAALRVSLSVLEN